MRIAFVSYEFPPDTAWGGISTYVSQISRCLAQRGVDVEVFCGSTARTDCFFTDGVRVNRLHANREAFPAAILPVFLRRHQTRPFDLIEGPDYLAEAGEVAHAAPEVPYVVKLHTPYYFVSKLNQAPTSLARIRDFLRLIWYVFKTRDASVLLGGEHRIFQAEKQNLHIADEVVAPSEAIARVVGKKWRIDSSRMSLVPLAYEASRSMLEIPVETDTGRITYVGRLEYRKGVQDLAKAIPLVLRKNPLVRFRFIGATGMSGKPGIDMQTDILNAIPAHMHSQLEFTGNVPPDDLPRYLRETDICVFPSRWESFGFVVLEAMAAGRAIVCSDSGGMAELLNHGEYGLLVRPKNPRALARSLTRLYRDPILRHSFGHKARERGMARYTSDSITPLQLRSYERAIARRKLLSRPTIPPLADFRTWLAEHIHPPKNPNLELETER